MKSFLLSVMSLFSLSLVLCTPLSASPIKILFLGDSLTEGYGINKTQAYPYQAKEFLQRQGIALEILNGSVSGSTTASAESRLKWFLKAKPQWLFLALGANDGLRGIKTNESRKNLDRIIRLAKKNGIKVALAGMMVPPNYGPDYGKKFKEIFQELSREHDIAYIPFLLKDVAGESKYNQEDGIHPNEEGHTKMGENVGKFLLPLLKEK